MLGLLGCGFNPSEEHLDLDSPVYPRNSNRGKRGSTYFVSSADRVKSLGTPIKSNVKSFLSLWR